MNLSPGQNLLHYRLVDKLGEGGMGVVWRAVDTTLDREVAIKILPESFASDAERLARFEREAKLLASLNHPNIAAVHSVHEHEGVRFLSMELVGGQDLSTRLAAGPVPLEEALGVARQIAEALEAAHTDGVIHRDLKPANIRLTPDGRVKVLDFGLAKALGSETPGADPALSPTMTSAGSIAGQILGTAGYMSPEQARGQLADRRADIWAFGAVLYELLAGRPLFEGQTVSDILASVLKTDPDWSALPPETPPGIRRLLRRCLTRDPRARLHDVADARIEIDEAGEPVDEATAPAGAAIVVERPAVKRWIVGVGVAGLALGALLVSQLDRAPEVERRPLRASLLPPEGTRFEVDVSPAGGTFAPDGQSLVYQAVDQATGAVQLYHHDLASGQSLPLEGADFGQYPFWSPDSRWIGFFQVSGGNVLKKIRATGGPPVMICRALNGKGGSWNSEGTIIFAPSFGSGIFRVSADGGEPQPLTEIDATRHNSHRHPRFLPDGRHYLYFARSNDPQQPGAVMLGSLDGEVSRELLRSASQAEYRDGHLLFVRDGTLVARPFDATAFEFRGEPTPIAREVLELPGAAYASFSLSNDGGLAFDTSKRPEPSPLEWRDRSGASLGTVGEPVFAYQVVLSPAGDQVVIALGADGAGGSFELWIHDLKRDLRTRLTTEAGDQYKPIWSPDGKSVYYASNHRDGRFDIYRRAADRVAPPELVVDHEENVEALAISPDGRQLIFKVVGAESTDLWVIDLDGEDSDGRPLFESAALERWGDLSPDGRWLVFAGQDEGRSEIYVTDFPDAKRRWQISTDGGGYPLWRRDGNEILYHRPDGLLGSVTVNWSDGQPEFERPTSLFHTVQSIDYPSFSPSADGERILIIGEFIEDPRARIELVLNWPEALAESQGR